MQPNTIYHYRAYQVSGTYSADSTFITSCAPGTNFRFDWMADNRDHGPIWNTLAGIIDDSG